MNPQSGFVDIDWDGRPVSIEYQWAGEGDSSLPLVVFLHEGLGSLAMWKDFPAGLFRALDCRGLVYSRPGGGWSTPRAAGEKWDTDYLHRQATELLPALLAALGIDAAADPPWLLGHSDGGSIALIYAARFPDSVAGAILLSPHISVEDKAIASIARARDNYLETDMRAKLARYHANPDSVFWGWNDIWLKPEFRHWSILAELDAIECPLLAVQGLDDEYGTLEQVHGIARRVAGAQVAELADCGHSPQRDQPQALLELAAGFFAAHAGAAGRRERAGRAG